MAVSRIWYPEPVSPTNFRRVPSSVESCLQWQDTAPERSVVNSQVIRTSSVERCDVLSRQQQQQLREASPTRGNIYCHYDGAGRNALYDARQQAARCTGRNCSFRCRSPCRRLANANVTSTRPCCHLLHESDTRSTWPQANPAGTWSTLDGCHEEDDVIEAERFADKRRYGGIPSRPLRSALRSSSPSRRRVEVCEDENGRLVDMIVTRPVTPQMAPEFSRPGRRAAAETRRFIEDGRGGVVQLIDAGPSRNDPRVQFAPQTTRHPSSRPTSAWQQQQVRDDVITGSRRCDHVTTGDVMAVAGYQGRQDDDRQALMAIYQAGKSGMQFHTRAPSTAALEKMLVALSDCKVGDTSAVVDSVRNYPQRACAERGRGRRTGHDVSDDDKPVKVKVECPPHSDTMFSFRVQSRAA